MDKKKTEQVILVVLLPVFLIGLLYMRSKASSSGAPVKETAIMEVPEDKEIDKIPKASDHKFESKYEQVPRDPLNSHLVKYLIEREKNRSRVPEQVAMPAISIEGLIWNTNMPQAIINGRVVRIGDNVGGIKVINIENTGITFEYQGKPVFVAKR